MGNLRCQKTTVIRGLGWMIDLFEVIYWWWALHLFSMVWPTFGGFSTPVWPSRNAPRWPGRGLFSDCLEFSHTHTCDGEVRIIRVGVDSQVILFVFFSSFTSWKFLHLFDDWWVLMDDFGPNMAIHGIGPGVFPFFLSFWACWGSRGLSSSWCDWKVPWMMMFCLCHKRLYLDKYTVMVGDVWSNSKSRFLEINNQDTCLSHAHKMFWFSHKTSIFRPIILTSVMPQRFVVGYAQDHSRFVMDLLLIPWFLMSLEAAIVTLPESLARQWSGGGRGFIHGQR